MRDHCPVCNNTEFKILGKSKTNSVSAGFLNQDYHVVQCISCKIYFVSPEIDFNDEQWSRLYNSEYFSVQSQWLINQRRKELKKRFNKAESYLQGAQKISLLDVGSGEGRALLEGHSRGWDVTGIDIVDNRIDEAKGNDIKFIRAKFLDYDFPVNSFDLVYLDSVLEHVLAPVQYLTKINNLLKPGGVLYIGVPNEDSLFNEVRRLAFNVTGKRNISEKIKPFDSPYHVIGFNKDSLHYAINKTGFQVKTLRNFGRKFEFLSSPPNHRSFWLSLLFLFPVEILGYLMKKDVYYEAYLKK